MLQVNRLMTENSKVEHLFKNISLKKTIVVIYCILLVFGVLYVHKVVSSESNDLTDLSSSKKTPPKAQNIKVVLTIKSAGASSEYTIEGTSPFSPLDLLEELHNTNDLIFEKTYYRDGLVLDNINRVQAPINSKWAFFVDGEEIKQDIPTYQLQDGKTYELKIVKN